MHCTSSSLRGSKAAHRRHGCCHTPCQMPTSQVRLASSTDLPRCAWSSDAWEQGIAASFTSLPFSLAAQSSASHHLGRNGFGGNVPRSLLIQNADVLLSCRMASHETCSNKTRIWHRNATQEQQYTTTSVNVKSHTQLFVVSKRCTWISFGDIQLQASTALSVFCAFNIVAPPAHPIQHQSEWRPHDPQEVWWRYKSISSTCPLVLYATTNSLFVPQKTHCHDFHLRHLVHAFIRSSIRCCGWKRAWDAAVWVTIETVPQTSATGFPRFSSIESASESQR